MPLDVRKIGPKLFVITLSENIPVEMATADQTLNIIPVAFEVPFKFR